MSRRGASVHIVSSGDGDWKGLYVDGALVTQGHSIRPSDILDALTGKTLKAWTEHCLDGVDNDCLGARGTLPDRLADAWWSAHRG